MKRWLVRFAAPAAFLLAATIAVLLVRSALRADDDQPGPATVTRTATAQARTSPARRPPSAPRRRTYVVQEGDTLDEIAVEHDTTVEQLLALNPGVEPTELRPGQHLRVP